MSQSIAANTSKKIRLDKEKINIKHLKWSVDSRHKNQIICLELLELFDKNEQKWKTKRNSRWAQDLIAVSFSLWRAAFLAERRGGREFVFNDGKSFLSKVIEDNAISYAQDKNSREWTFNYYTRNAQFHLEHLHDLAENVFPPFERKNMKATERWDYCHNLLEQDIKCAAKNL